MSSTVYLMLRQWLLDMGNLAKRETINQSEQFTPHQNVTQRSLAVSSSTVAIFSCLIAIYCFLAIDPKRLVFRHQLIAFLLLFDLLKACILLLYPARVLSHPTSYGSERFCQVVGFFSATAIEGADLAILSFALHTLLLIFKPSLSVKIPESDRVEGGLYKYRYYVYGLSFVIPLIMASLAYIGYGYSSYVCWCYLPQHPVWYRLVLSWVPRYLIVVTIILVYGLIYYYVLKEFKALGGVFSTLQHRHKRDPNIKPSFFSALKFFLIDTRDSIRNKFIVPKADQSTSSSNNSQVEPEGTRVKPILSLDESPATEAHNDVDHTRNIMHDPEIEAANMANFRKRQKIIERQMKSIFIYPIAYVSIWLFPFILQCTQFNYEAEHGPVVWLNYLSAFMQPFNGFVDSLVFFYREEPWKYTVMKNYEKENSYRLDHYVRHHSGDLSALQRQRKYSAYSGSTSVDIHQYSWWRRILGKLRLPLMRLPTEENVTKFQKNYLNTRFEEQRPSSGPALGNPELMDAYENPDFTTLMTKHDYSNLLHGDIAEGDFRLALEGYSLNFKDRRSSTSSLGRRERRASAIAPSVKSGHSRRLSVMGPHESIPETKEYVRHEAHGPRKGGSQPNTKRSSHRSDHSGSNSEEHELDFLQFLRDGP